MLSSACGDSNTLRARNQEANQLFAAGDYEAALAAYQELLAERPDVDQLSYNAGNALHRLEAYERAIAETQRALPPTDVRLGVATYFSLGNHLLQLGRLEEAYAAYRSALLLNPNDEDAKFNLELTLLLSGAIPQPGGDQPQDGDQGDAGEGTPSPGEGQPGAEGSPGPEGQSSPAASGSPGPGAGATPQASPGAADPNGSQRTLAQALAGIDEELTFEEAIEILDLLREQQQTPRPGPGSRPAGPDY
jgi:tetratricopeptide (TPR) repeat protein